METYLAHWDEDNHIQSLQDHIRGVEELAAAEGETIGVSNIMRLITLCHDVGKYSDAFQEYIRQSKGTGVSGKGSVNHTSAGAEILMSRYQKIMKNEECRALLEMICYVITAHHGLYDMVSIEDADNFARRLGGIEIQELRMVFERWSCDLHLNMSDIDEIMQAAHREYKAIFSQKFRDISDLREYRFYQGCFVRLLLSMQIDADWTDTADAMETDPVQEIQAVDMIMKKAWENYCDYMERIRCRAVEKQMTKKETQINHLRTQIQEESLAFTKHSAGIYCLAIPTGAGKTLTSLGYALKFANERIGTKEAVEQIFYISPYISITEQNARVMKEAVGNEDWVLEHHSNVVNSDDAGRNAETSWKECFICTTMVQYFEYALFR